MAITGLTHTHLASHEHRGPKSLGLSLTEQLPHSSPDHHNFPEDLSDDVKVFLLETVFQQSGLKSFEAFVGAFPELSSRILVITDHKDIIPTDLIALPPSTRSINLFELSESPWLYSGQWLLKILCFSKPEQNYVGARLSDSLFCPYAQFMTPNTPVIIKTFSENSPVYTHLQRLIAQKGVRLVSTVEVHSSDHAEIHASKYIPPQLRSLMMKTRPRDDDGSMFFKQLEVPQELQIATTLDLHSVNRFGSRHLLQNLKTLRIQFTDDCVGDPRHLFGCKQRMLSIETPNLNHLQVQFSKGRIPFALWCGGMLPSLEVKCLSIIDTNWSFSNPYSETCIHASCRGLCQSVTGKRSRMRYRFGSGESRGIQRRLNR